MIEETKKLILKRDIGREEECGDCTGTGYVACGDHTCEDEECESCDTCNGSGYIENEGVDPDENVKAAHEFLKDVIRSAGFNPKTPEDDSYGNATVNIKEFGGDFYLKVSHSFEEVCGDPEFEEHEVEEIILECADYDADCEHTFDSYREAVDQLPALLNAHAGTIRKLTKGEAKKNKAA